MNDTTNLVNGSCHRPRIWLWWARSLLAVLVLSLALFAVACSSNLPGLGTVNGSRHSTPTSNPSSRTTSSNPSSEGTTSGSSYTVAFAECMRSHGMPHFPNPGKGAAFGPPGSGVDPASPQFQNALQACKSLAPPAWASGGPVSNP
jgi:hypothetical protein